MNGLQHMRLPSSDMLPVLSGAEQDGGQQADCNPYGVPQSSVDDTKPGWSPSDSMLAEAAENLSRLLGVNGEETRKCEDALEQVVDVHRSDGKMYHEYVSHVAMPSWLLTEVRTTLHHSSSRSMLAGKPPLLSPVTVCSDFHPVLSTDQSLNQRNGEPSRTMSRICSSSATSYCKPCDLVLFLLAKRAASTMVRLHVQVQHCKLMAAHTEIGVSVIDMFRLFKAAAHEERWEALFGGFRV